MQQQGTRMSGHARRKERNRSRRRNLRKSPTSTRQRTSGRSAESSEWWGHPDLCLHWTDCSGSMGLLLSFYVNLHMEPYGKVEDESSCFQNKCGMVLILLRLNSLWVTGLIQLIWKQVTPKKAPSTQIKTSSPLFTYLSFNHCGLTGSCSQSLLCSAVIHPFSLVFIINIL